MVYPKILDDYRFKKRCEGDVSRYKKRYKGVLVFHNPVWLSL